MEWQKSFSLFCEQYNETCRQLLEHCQKIYLASELGQAKQSVRDAVRAFHLSAYDLKFMLFASARLGLVRLDTTTQWSVERDILRYNYTGLCYPVPIFFISYPLLAHVDPDHERVLREASETCLPFLCEFVADFMETINTLPLKKT